MTAARSRMAEKIAALRAKTSAAGCTEAEALAAAELAARLMREHGVSEAELGMTEERARETTSRATWRSDLVGVIAFCTNTEAVLLASEQAWLFVGRDPGPAIAVYLREICFRAVAAEEKRFKASLFYRRRRSGATRRAAATDFRVGLVFNLSWRLRKLFGPTVDPATREAARAVARSRLGDLVTMRAPKREPTCNQAVTEGLLAGNRVALNRAVDGRTGPAGLLGRRP